MDARDPTARDDRGDALDAGLAALYREEARGTEARLAPHLRRGYELFGEIARGGMGVVLRGRDTSLERDVAVKVLREDLAGEPAAFGRFIEEARIGGRLQHPGIVPVYELGALADRRPFFAMKLVEGRTLAALLAEREGRERWRLLDVFEAVCHTIAYAHSRGVVHRDLKPANVLVGAFGEVQVVDWGLAKVLRGSDAAPSGRAELPARAVDSVSGAVMGTPAYMPPEQARGDHASVDERSDVFALGALLCELLTGDPPYRGDGAASLAAAIAALTGDARLRLERCGADPELVALCNACLAPEPSARPRSAVEVAERVHAHRAAVDERARAARVRAAEERVRARAVLAFAATALVLVAGGATLWTSWRERTARRIEAAERAVSSAAQEAELARGRGEFAAALAAIGRANERVQGGDVRDDLRARVASLGAAIEDEARAARAASELAADNAHLLSQLADVRQPEGDAAYPTDWAALDRAYLAIFAGRDLDVDAASTDAPARALGARGISIELASVLDDWASVRRSAKDVAGATRLAQLSNVLDGDEHRAAVREAIAKDDARALRAIAADASTSSLPAATLRLLGHALVRSQALDAALPLLTAARRSHPQDFALAIELARALRLTQPPRAWMAVAQYEAALALRPDSVEVWHELGVTLADYLQRPADALELFRSALALAPDDGHLHFHVGLALMQLGRHQESLASYARALELDPRDARAHCDLGIALDTLGRTEESLASYRRALEIDPEFVGCHHDLGISLRKLGRYEEAIESFDEALRISPRQAVSHFERGYALYSLRRDDEAIASYRRAVELAPQDGVVLVYLGLALQRAQREAEAIEAFASALRTTPNDPRTLRSLAWILCTASDPSLHDVPRALQAAQRAVELAPQDENCAMTLGLVQYCAQDFDAARESIERANELGGDDAAREVLLSLCFDALGDHERASSAFDSASANLEDVTRTIPTLQPFVVRARELAAAREQR